MSVAAVSERLSNLGEGPHWDVNTQKLYYVDAFVGDICRLDQETGKTEAVHFDGLVTFVIPYFSDPKMLLISFGKEVRKLNFSTRQSELMGLVDPDLPTSRFNDGKCDANGRLWTGTVAEGQTGNLYRMDSSYQFKAFADKIVLSNGLSWSVDHRTLYYNDSEARIIYSFDFDVAEGTAKNQKVVVNFNANSNYTDLGAPDGMTTDIEGKLWVACFGGSCVLRIDPNTGEILRKVEIPAKNTTSCCFGGPHFDVLYVTTAWMNLTDAEREAQPQAGAVFAVTDLGVRGQPPFHFRD